MLGWVEDKVDFEIPNTLVDMDVVLVGVKIGVFSSAFDLISSAPLCRSSYDLLFLQLRASIRTDVGQGAWRAFIRDIDTFVSH